VILGKAAEPDPLRADLPSGLGRGRFTELGERLSGYINSCLRSSSPWFGNLRLLLQGGSYIPAGNGDPMAQLSSPNALQKPGRCELAAVSLIWHNFTALPLGLAEAQLLGYQNIHLVTLLANQDRFPFTI
jgi:hypothetical protein